MVWLIIAGIITLIIALALAMLLLPVTVYVDMVRSGGKVSGSFSISWLLLLIRYALKDKKMEIFIFSRRIASLSRREKPLATEKIKRPRVSKKSRIIPSIRHIFNLAGPLLRLLKDLVAAFRLRHLDFNIAFGLNNPAYTGILTGLLHAIRGSLQIGHGIRFIPDFTGEVLNWNLRAEAAVTPIRLLSAIARFIASRKVLRSGWEIIRDSQRTAKHLS